MNIKDFSERIPKIKNLHLPGKESHYKMAPLLRIEELGNIDIAKRKPRKAAVMALFYPDVSKTTRLLLILRKTYKGVHSNQIGLPGGKAEKTDNNLLETALRETEEEVGVPIHEVEVIRSLSEIYIPPSNFEVQPYMGLYPNPKPFQMQATEVEALLEVPLSHFLDDANLISKKLTTSYATNIDVPAFKLNGYTVWGATAMMLSEIKELLKQVF
ncbi:NUDIX hydrolase [Costertonia aggregata]|uniref:CoA pyrophosphatase n=1 Tax=Costertonia aggregata TaxID=343403 RepID=A0A7H9ASP2_9FLAO|nr:CoA pyrophosphatase [Costertonia aggregata]QLG46427.1 CoA pyrophosphatase [Costertonia aggregata]